MLLRSGPILICSLLLALSSSAFAGKCTGSCGGDGFRMLLADVAVDTFRELEQMADKGLIELPIESGRKATLSAADLEVLRTALLAAINTNEIRLDFSVSDSMYCPLKDNSGTCVTFLTETDSHQLSVDMGRLVRTKADISFLRRGLIHESYRLALQDDDLYQKSRWLGRLVEKNSKASENLNRRLEALVKSYRADQKIMVHVLKNRGTTDGSCEAVVVPKQEGGRIHLKWNTIERRGRETHYSADFQSETGIIDIKANLDPSTGGYWISMIKNGRIVADGLGMYPLNGDSAGSVSYFPEADSYINYIWVACGAD